MYIVLLSIVKPAWEHERSDWKTTAQMWVWNCGPWGGRLVDRADWQFWHHCGHSQLILATSLTLVSQFRFTKKMYILVSHPHSEIVLQTLLHYGDHMFSLKKKKNPALLEGTFQRAQNSFFYLYVDAAAYAHRGMRSPLLFNYLLFSPKKFPTHQQEILKGRRKKWQPRIYLISTCLSALDRL